MELATILTNSHEAKGETWQWLPPPPCEPTVYHLCICSLKKIQIVHKIKQAVNLAFKLKYPTEYSSKSLGQFLKEAEYSAIMIHDEKLSGNFVILGITLTIQQHIYQW